MWMGSRWKNRLKQLLKIVISAAALYLVFSKISFEEVLAVYRQANWLWLPVAVLLFATSKLVAALRLNRFFGAVGVPLSEKQNIRLYLLGMFYNLFLPGGIGGDGYKVYYLKRRYEAETKHIISAVVLDRIAGLAALAALAAILAVFLRLFLSQYLKFLPLLIIPAYFIARYIIRRYFSLFTKIFNSVLLLSLGVQSVQLLSAFCILQAMGQQQLIMSYLFLFLVSSLAAAIPFTIGGAGARELTFLYGSGLFGIDVHAAVALSLTFYLITVLVSATGLWYVVLPGKLKQDGATTNKHALSSD